MIELQTRRQVVTLIERRSHQRAPLVLPARYLSNSGEEVDCVTIDVSATGISFKTARPPRIGDAVIAYIRDLGRVQGVASRHLDDGFAMAIVGTALKTQRLAEKIAQLTGAPERRLFQRLELDGARMPLRTAHGEEFSVDIVDVSTKGVAFKTEMELRLGDAVDIGGRTAVVARLFNGGAAASFL